MALSLPGLESVTQGRLDLEDDPPDVGYANAEIKISGSELLKNLHMVQDRNNLDRSTLGGHAGRVTLPELEVEMETGTGKTFVYTKTIFELNKCYGWSKFIIIVPGVAIREGVKKSIEITAEKFFADYGKTLKKHIYDYLLSDSKGERKFARELDNADEVEVFAKLPSGFKIPTPVGDYNPDWAVAFKKGKVKYLYFVAETKGSLSGMELRKIEQAKISYAEKHFKALSGADFKYHVVTSYDDLLKECVG